MEDNAYLYLKPQSVRQQFDPEFQPNPRNKSMSCSSFLLKILVIALFLCLIPLFPSEPPEFISKTVFAKSWELIHLLVIGIALSYGLFCRRKNPEQVSPKSHNFQQYKPNVVHHSSIFDCVDENPSVKFDKNVVENKRTDFSGFRTEPYVVVRERNGENVEERSLGLPVRSLRSRVVDSDSEDECVSECESESSGESECSNSSSCAVSEKGEILEGNVESNGFGNGWNSRSVREGFMAENGVFEVNDGKSENFEGNFGSNGFSDGVKSRSMRASSMAGNSDFEIYGEKGENFGGNMVNNGFSDGVKSRSMRASSMAGNSDFEIYGEKGENLEGNLGSNGFSDGVKSRSMRASSMAGNSDFEIYGEKGENFGGNMGNNGFSDGVKSRSMRASSMAGNSDFEIYGEKGENLEGNLGSNGFSDGVKSRSMRASSMAGNSDFEIYGEKGENFEGNMGNNGFSNGVKSRSMRGSSMAGNTVFEVYDEKGENFQGKFSYGLKSRSMRAGFMVGNADFELHSGKGENFEGNVGSNVFPNEWNSGSMMGFMPGCGGFELRSGEGRNLEGNVEVSAPPNGCESRFMTGNVDNFVGNMGSNAFPYGRNSRSMNTGYTAESGKVELASAKGENLDENLGNSSQVSWKSRSMRSNLKVNNSALEPELLKSRSFRSPVQGGASCGMNAGVCSWLPESPNMPFPNFCTQVDNSNLVGSAPTSEKCNTTSNFYMPSTATLPSVPVSTSDFASGSRMHDYEKGSWGTPTILENANTFVENPANFMLSEKDLSQPICSSSPKKNEEYFMPRTPEIPPSTLRPPGKSKSKLRLSSKKNEEQLEKDISVVPLEPRDTSGASRIIPPVSIPTSLENVSSPINVTFPKKNEDFFLPVDPNKKNTSLDSDSRPREAPNNEFASSVRTPTWANMNRRPLLKKDSGLRSESNYETPKDEIFSSKGSFLNKNEKKATPVKWDENCFVIPLSENNDTEDLVQQPACFSEVASSRSRLSSDEQESEQNGVDEDVLLKEPAYLFEAASSRSRMSCDEQESEQTVVEEDVLLKEPSYVSGVASSRSRLSCDEQESEHNGVEEDVQLKETIDYSEIEVLSKEIEAYKPSTPSPPGTVSVESICKALSDSFLLESPKKVKSLSKAPHSRGFSCTSFFDRELRKSIKNEAREENRMSEGDQYVGKAGKCGCLSLDVRPTLSKAALKGKSVRTIRPREAVPETINRNVQSDQKKEENSGMVVIKIGISEKRSSSNGRKREKQGGGGTSIIVGVSSKEGPNSKAGVLCDVKEEEPDSEIDKKADEFIAKFKEQIRIEKVTTRGGSIRRQVPQKKSLYQT